MQHVYSWYNPTIFLRFNIISVCIKKTIIILICLFENRSLIFIYHWYLAGAVAAQDSNLGLSLEKCKRMYCCYISGSTNSSQNIARNVRAQLAHRQSYRQSCKPTKMRHAWTRKSKICTGKIYKYYMYSALNNSQAHVIRNVHASAVQKPARAQKE